MTMVPSPLAAQVKATPVGGVKLSVPLEHALWDYQVNDVAWMLAQRSGLVGHDVGTGKTVFGIAVAAYLRSRGMFEGMVVLMPKQAGLLLKQWAEEFQKWAPDFNVVIAGGLDKAERHQAYREPWDVLLLNYEAARLDVEKLKTMVASRPLTLLYCDEASLFRNPTSAIAKTVRSISAAFPFRFAVTGTPIETRVEDLWSIMACMGWEDVVGTKAQFLREFTIREQEEFYVKGGRKMRRTVVVGYQNLGELRRRLEPWFIRRTGADPDVAKHLPEVMSFVLRPKMTPAQARGYKALKKGIVAKMSKGEVEITTTGISAPWIQLLGAADGLRTLDPEMKDESGKSDWLLEALEGQFANEKMLVFSRFARSIPPIAQRLEAAGIGYGRFMGRKWQSDLQREEDVERFKTDPECRVLLATTAVERGLNLQAARVVVFYGIVPNPSRLTQIVGRIRRGSSEFASVYAITLLTQGTVEEGLYDSTIERAALADWFWEDDSVLFEKLGPQKLAELIRS